MTSNPPAQKRQPSIIPASSAAAAAKPRCTIHPSAIIADRATLAGPHAVTIGANAVLHPYARVSAEGGRVELGALCTVAEAAVVGLAEGGGEGGDVVLGEGVCVETGAEVQAASVGDGTEVGIRARIGRGAVVGKVSSGARRRCAGRGNARGATEAARADVGEQFCRIAPRAVVRPGERLEDFTVAFGEGGRRVDRTAAESPGVREARMKGQERHVEALRRLVPNASMKWTT